MNKIFVLDIANIQFRAIFNYRSNPKIPATYTFMSMITGYFGRLNVDLSDTIICACDFSSWRKAEEKKYKSQREDDRLKQEEKSWWNARYSEFNQLYKKLDMSLPYHWIKIWLVEFDDIASVCARYYKDKEIIIISSDSDICQLAFFPNVKIFSPISKKFKEIKNPMNLLLSKIEKGDKSDNLTEKVNSEIDFEHRKRLVDLISPLPENIENQIKEALSQIKPKNLYIQRVPYESIKKKLIKIYHLYE
jgi:5'-3' exonuclease